MSIMPRIISTAHSLLKHKKQYWGSITQPAPPWPKTFSLLVWLTGHGKTLAAWINTWKLLALSSVIPSKKHKRTWMRWASTALYRKPVACQESLAADCFPGRQTSRRTMTFVRPPKSSSKKCRGSVQKLMRCSRWANEPLTETMPRW